MEPRVGLNPITPMIFLFDKLRRLLGRYVSMKSTKLRDSEKPDLQFLQRIRRLRKHSPKQRLIQKGYLKVSQVRA